MTRATAGRGRKIFAGLIAATVPGAAFAVLAGAPATGANDPCAASEGRPDDRVCLQVDG